MISFSSKILFATLVTANLGKSKLIELLSSRREKRKEERREGKTVKGNRYVGRLSNFKTIPPKHVCGETLR